MVLLKKNQFQYRLIYKILLKCHVQMVLKHQDLQNFNNKHKMISNLNIQHRNLEKVMINFINFKNKADIISIDK